ncbi:hypothetical protein HP456_23125 [Bacillus haikouensis]|uniref:hypothetical protein n=1 Tax=Bacillus haikouensis TaxID=1510468 RepID=UPI00155732BC|nr:hypothetical protein [Bacillus haikouensis]NQD68803.1 hypothetical protein [Bacillus haikouensis]
MVEHQIEDLFHFYGHEDLYKRFKTPLYVTGLFDDSDAEDLEDFFDQFTLDRSILFDEFRFWFRYFEVSKTGMDGTSPYH